MDNFFSLTKSKNFDTENIMIPDIKNKNEEIRKIWLEHRDKENALSIFRNYLDKYFDVVTMNLKSKTPQEFIYFAMMVRKWKKEEITERINQDSKNLTDDEISEIQNQNRKRTILMLRETLSKYETNPTFLSKLTVKEISMLYRIVQGAEEAMKRTEVAKGKLKLDAARTFLLPYQRMSVEELEKLKKVLNASIEQIVKLKSSGPDGGVGQGSLVSGGA